MINLSPGAKTGILLAITMCGILPVASYLAVPDAHGMVRFNSNEELQRFLLLESRCAPRTSDEFGGPLTTGPAQPMVSGRAQYESNSGVETSIPVNAVPSHSQTNNQVVGVDELDTVKNDGEYIYTLTNNTIAIVHAYPISQARLESRIVVKNETTIQGIFLDGDHLSIVTGPGNYPYITCGGPIYAATPAMGVAMPTCYGCTNYYYQTQNTRVLVYNVADRSRPTLQSSVTLDGSFVGARRIGDMVYVVSTSPAIYNQTLPTVSVNGRKTILGASQVYHSDVIDQAFSYTSVLGLNIADTSYSPNIQSFLLGTSSTIYVSNMNIFLSQPVWLTSMGTVIHRISIANSSITYIASGTVPGHVLNQFSMDESNDHFRIATSNNNGWNMLTGTGTGVYILDDESMHTVGRLEGISPGEMLYAARFMGDRAYLVTFKQQDPLFVLDLSTPNNPTLLGQLNVTGVSEYLQPYDTGHLIGIGKSSQNVAWENAARFYGLKLSLFDVTDPNTPKDLSDYTVGDFGTDSPGLTDQKAVLFDRSLNLLVIPILVAGQSSPISSSGYYDQSAFQGAFVFQVTVDHGIVLRGTITHVPSGIGAVSSFGYSSAFFVTRALYIGTVLYTISPAMIRMNSLDNLSDLDSVVLV